MRQKAQDIDTEKIKSWIRTSVDKMIEIADAEAEIRNQQKQINDAQAEVDEEVNHKATLSLMKEKLMVKKYMLEGQPEEQ